MSRIGKKPITIPEGIEISVDKNRVSVKGSKGELSLDLKKYVSLEISDNQVVVSRNEEHKHARAMHGTVRSLIANMIVGVSQGFKKELELVGIGYRVKKEGNNLSLSLGYSHPVIFEAVENVDLKVEGTNKIIVSGIDKHLVGQVAANIRALRPPEPYKGKGIRYSDEVVIKKAGKAGKAE